jgi:putative membrane protein
VDYYFWIKTAHIIAVMTFIGGMFLNGFLLRYIVPGQPQSDRLIAAARFWNGPIIGLALLLVWVLGLTLATLGHAFNDVWLMIKMALVFLLSGLHGAQTGAFRRLQHTPPVPVPTILRHSAALTFGFIIVIVALVVLQPFR